MVDPTSNPAGTLGQINNPLTNAVTGQNQAQPTATDQAAAPPPSGSATLGQRFPGFQSAWTQKYSNAASNAMAAGLGPLQASVVGAIHANDPSKPVPPTIQGSPQPDAGTTSQGPQSLAQQAGGAIRGIGASLGDVAAVGTAPSGGGALTGIARTLGARAERQQKEAITESELDKNKVMMTEANIRMQHEQRLIHNMDEDAKNQSMLSGQKQLETLRTQPAPGKVIAKDLLSNEITPYLQKAEGSDAKFDPTKETAIPTGIKTIGETKDGRPITALTYSLVSVPDDVTLDPSDPKQKAELDFLNANAPPDKGNWGVGGAQHFTGTEYNLIRQQANDKMAADTAADRARLQAGFNLKDIKQGQESLNFQNDGTMVNALARASTNGNYIAARNAIMADPKLAAKYPNLDNDIRQYLGYTEGKDGKKEYVYDKMLDDYQKKLDANQESITAISNKLSTAGSAQEVNQIGADAQARYNDPNTPKEQLPQLKRIIDRANAGVSAAATFKANEEREAARVKKSVEEEEPNASPGDLALVKQIGEGRSLFPNTRSKEGLRMGKLVATAYPGFREDLAPSWFDINKKIAGGQLGQSIVSSNTVLEHMRRAWDNTNWSSVANPFGESRQKLEVDKPFLTGELGKAVKGGVITEGESHTIMNALFGGWTPSQKQDRLKEAAQLLMDRIDTQQQHLDETNPSPGQITSRTLLRPDAKSTYEYITSGGKVNKTVTQTQKEQEQNQQVKQQTGAPAGAQDPGKVGKSANGIPVWPMRDGSIQDASGNKYDPITGQPLKK